ncbi:MAG: histidine phosphatase family protein, partial [Oscillospiraceae bacterium]|nr:histidine phosphatase family protein [Oscillospiraceae bacterium]
MQVIYVRHGETDWNEAHLLQGWSDIPLNEAGILQAEKTRALLKDTSFDRI